MDKLGVVFFIISIASAGFIVVLAAQKRFISGLFSIFLVASFLALISYTNNLSYIIAGGLILALITYLYIYFRYKIFLRQ